MLKTTLQALLKDRRALEDLQRSTATIEAVRAVTHTDKSIDALFNAVAKGIRPGPFTPAEAIILLHGRPALLIQDGKWATPSSSDVAARLKPATAALQAAIPRVGRIEILDFETDYVGTGWMISDDVMVTNRHVAELFAIKRGTRFGFRVDETGRVRRARVDFVREHDRTATRQFGIKDVVFLEDPIEGRPDFALVRLDAAAGTLPPPIELEASPVAFNTDVAVIGYPARDTRNDAFVMDDIFNGIYDVKRLSPGRVMGVQRARLIEHDCTTLGGNSGSVVINLATGRACGLHFSGSYRVRNLAVATPWLLDRLTEISPLRVVVNRSVRRTPAAPSAPKAKPLPRRGYLPNFLGATPPVPLPAIPDPLRGRIAPVKGSHDGVLDYTHFSVVMRSDRRMPFFTACNIDGNRLFNFPRAKDQWVPDERVSRQHQADPAVFEGNALDRGHLVRRLDPAWGATRNEAKQAEVDTFHLTNCAPQHERLNQRTWLALEDYILDNTANHSLRVTVFAGPVMNDSDRRYRGIRLPEEYWKIAVIMNGLTGTLSATGYLLSQADYLGDLEFTFGAYRTYQVPLAQIEAKTRLMFGLGEFDPLARIETSPQREIRTASDILL